MSQPPGRIGITLAEVETPALIVDLDAFERNLDRMTRSLEGRPVRLRPHAKTHKCPEVARRQIERGAVGVCCQTVAEAEEMVAGGVGDVLVTNQVVTPGKIARLVALAAGGAAVAPCVDDAENIRDLDIAAGGAGVRLPVLVEVNIGQDRAGVDPGAPALALAQFVEGRRNLRFAGLHAYQGLAQHVYGLEARSDLLTAAFARVAATLALFHEAGVDPGVVTGGGTGSYPFEVSSGLYNEVQPGSYVFMDADYARVEAAGDVYESSLSVLTTVVSRSRSRGVCDAGLKASSMDSGLPIVFEMPEVRYAGASDEHGTLLWDDHPGLLQVGDRIRLIPGHCDPTVNLHDWLVCIRSGRVEALWPVAARGPGA